MAVQLNPKLKALLLASQLGLNQHHPLAGWHMLTILYHDGTGSGSPMTLNFLVTKYNQAYLDDDETPIADQVLKKILTVLSEQAGLVETSPRKVREQMQNGGYHLHQSYVYRITSSGIQYLKMMQDVVEAENTITANISQIDEFCQLVQQLAQSAGKTQNTQLFNDFERMRVTYNNVMKGMHKLDEDLDELANNLAFDHGSQAAEQLQQMLNEKALPAFNQLMQQEAPIQALTHLADFPERVARSQQGQDDLDASHAVGDQAKMTVRFQRTRDYVRAQLSQIELSFTSTANAMDTSLDSMFMLFQTLTGVSERLSREYERIQSQTVDIQALTQQIDQLMTHYETVQLPTALPRHLALDRQFEDPNDFLTASVAGPVVFKAQPQPPRKLTVADNPEVVQHETVVDQRLAGYREFWQLVNAQQQLVVAQPLEFTTQLARDEVIRLYSATGYDHYESFAPFSRPVKAVQTLATGQLKLHCRGEAYSVFLPSGFVVQFEK